MYLRNSKFYLKVVYNLHIQDIRKLILSTPPTIYIPGNVALIFGDNLSQRSISDPGMDSPFWIHNRFSFGLSSES